MNENFAYLLKHLEAPKARQRARQHAIMYGCSNSTTHLTELPLARQEYGLQHGHLQVRRGQSRLADMYVTLLNTLGVETKQFGDSTRELNEILQA